MHHQVRTTDVIVGIEPWRTFKNDGKSRLDIYLYACQQLASELKSGKRIILIDRFTGKTEDFMSIADDKAVEFLVHYDLAM